MRCALFAAFVLGIGVLSFLTAARGDWQKCFLPAGLRMRAGDDIFSQSYVYPPFQAFVAALFTYPPPLVGRAMWDLLNAAAAGVFVINAWRLSGGAPWWRNRHLPATEAWIFALGFVATIGFLFDSITNRQTDLLVASLIVGGWWYFPCRPWGAASIGLSAAAKCTPLLFVPWLVFRRRWSLAAVAVLVMIGVNVVPDLFLPSTNGELRLWTWARTYFAPLLHPNYAVGAWFTGLDFNHSLSGVFRRLAPADAVRPLWIAAVAALIFTSGASIVRSRRAGESVERVEIGMILCLMVLISPASSKPHFCVLLLPAWTVAREAFVRNDAVLFAATVASALMGILANKDLVGATLYDAAKWSGVITWQALLLFGASVRAHALVVAAQIPRDESWRVGRSALPVAR